MALVLVVSSGHIAFAQVRKVAVTKPLDREGKIPYAHLLSVRGYLTKAISSAPGYEAFNRTELDVLAEEFRFQHLGPVGEDQRKRMGEMSGADYVCISEMATEGSNYVITVSLIEIESGKVVATEIEVVSTEPDAVHRACEGVSRRLLSGSDKSAASGQVGPEEHAGSKETGGRIPRDEPRAFPTEVELLQPHIGGQDRILLMSGHVIQGKVLGQSTLEVRYLEHRKKGPRQRTEPTSNVFSVTDSLGRERVWYFHDTIFGNDFTVDQMRWFIKGEQDARAGYKPFWPVLGGFVAGAGLTIGFNLEMNSMFLPPLYAGLMVLPRVHVTKGSLTDPVLEGDDHYAWGYAKVGRSRRVTRSLLSTAAGVAVGLVVRQFIINPQLLDKQ